RHEEHGKQRQDACRRLQRLAYRASPAAAGERVQHQIGQGTQRDAEEKKPGEEIRLMEAAGHHGRAFSHSRRCASGTSSRVACCERCRVRIYATIAQRSDGATRSATEYMTP